MGHGAEEFVADQALDHREPRRQCIRETHGDIVAIDREAPVGPPARCAADFGRHLHRAVEQRICESALDKGKACHGVSS
jgi:hypothetical protein